MLSVIHRLNVKVFICVSIDIISTCLKKSNQTFSRVFKHPFSESLFRLVLFIGWIIQTSQLSQKCWSWNFRTYHVNSIGWSKVVEMCIQLDSESGFNMFEGMHHDLNKFPLKVKAFRPLLWRNFWKAYMITGVILLPPLPLPILLILLLLPPLPPFSFF